MTWEEAVESIQEKEDFKDLVRDAYFDSDLAANVERFRASEEFKATLNLLHEAAPSSRVLADIGSGNGISTISLALEGYMIHSIEPDPSATVGANAIRFLVDKYKLAEKVTVAEKFGENTGLQDNSVEIVYIRQAMHHAANLRQMMRECHRILRGDGLLLTVRDHVIYNERDKKWFLDSHPLHKFYGGENAYTYEAYCDAMKAAGFTITKVIRHYDSVINYSPMSEAQFRRLPIELEENLKKRLSGLIGPLGKIKFLQYLYKVRFGLGPNGIPDEKSVPGRMYSFMAVKK